MGKKSKKQKEKVSTTPPGVKELSKSAKRHLTEYTTQLIQACMVQPEPGPKEFEYYLEIHALVEKIRALQADINCPPLEREKHINEYLEWLHQNGVDTSCVEITKFPEDQGGYGLKSIKDLKENDPFITVPKKIMITTDSAKASVLGPLIANDRILGAMPSVVLALHLLNERRTPDSFWRPYINVMPNDISNPLYFSPEDIKCLKGSPAQSDCIRQYRNIARQYGCLYRSLQQDANAAKLPIKDCFTFDDYRWAVATVMARQNQIPARNDSRYDFVLIPMWDMCNHCNGTISTEYNMEKDCIECFAMKPYKQGDQIFMFYGARSNAEFLVHSGFVYPDNELDRVAVKLGISKSDTLYDKKSELLSKLQLAPSRTFFIHKGSIPVDPQLMAFLRIFSMSEERLLSLTERELTEDELESLGEQDSPLTDEYLKIWSFLEARTTLLLRAYDTTAEEDEEMLKDKDLHEYRRLCILLRLCEKKILKEAQEFATKEKTLVSEGITKEREQFENAETEANGEEVTTSEQ